MATVVPIFFTESTAPRNRCQPLSQHTHKTADAIPIVVAVSNTQACGTNERKDGRRKKKRTTKQFQGVSKKNKHSPTVKLLEIVFPKSFKVEPLGSKHHAYPYQRHRQLFWSCPSFETQNAHPRAVDSLLLCNTRPHSFLEL